MMELLKLAVDAHGGMENWAKVRKLSARLDLNGRLCDEKGQGRRFNCLSLETDLHRQHVVLTSEADDWCSDFTPSVITLSKTDGTLIDSRAFPRQAFLTSAEDHRWTDIQATYICSYAIWTFMTLPFRYTGEAFSVEELPRWDEGGEIFRRLRVIFPDDSLQERRREHITYFDRQGIVRRHDCSSGAGGIVPGAIYASGYQTISGVCMPLVRQVYANDASSKNDGAMLAEIRLSDVTISRF